MPFSDQNMEHTHVESDILADFKSDTHMECSQHSDHSYLQPEIVDGVEQYEIEYIVQKKFNKYLVKWKGWPSSQNTWEPKTSLAQDVPDMVREFDEQQILKKIQVTEASEISVNSSRIVESQPKPKPKKKVSSIYGYYLTYSVVGSLKRSQL